MCACHAEEPSRLLNPAAEQPQEAPEGPPTVDDIPLPDLDDAQQARVRAALRPFAHMWSGKLKELRNVENGEPTMHRIDLKADARPFRCPPYRSGLKSRDLEKEEVHRMAAEGVIEPSQSEWGSPALLVPKPDGAPRFCVDYRRLNAVTVKDSYPLPRMDECLDTLGDAQWFTTLDAQSGYWQVPVHPDDRHKTAFV